MRNDVDTITPELPMKNVGNVGQKLKKSIDIKRGKS
jgi:hypothetical protein